MERLESRKEPTTSKSLVGSVYVAVLLVLIIEAAKVASFTLAWSGKVSDRPVMMMEAAKVASFIALNGSVI